MINFLSSKTKIGPRSKLHGPSQTEERPLPGRVKRPAKAGFLTSVLLPERLAGHPCPALHLRHSSLSFSRVTSAHSPRPGKTPESVTPSASGTPLFSCALRLSYSVVEHTISQPPFFVNPRRTEIHIWRTHPSCSF